MVTVLLLAPVPAKGTAGGIGKFLRTGPNSDYSFCCYVSPSVAHSNSPCDSMSAPFPFSPVQQHPSDVYIGIYVLDTSALFHMTTCRIRQ